MAQKLFYMVRHGESILNAAHIRQGSDGGLSEKGKDQAVATGERLRSITFDVVLASPYERTRETAEIIMRSVKSRKPIEFIDLLVERRNPSEIVGKSADDPQIKQIIDRIDKSYHSDDFRFSDEENFIDLKKRARSLLTYLEQRPEQKILIVTHSIFLKMIAALIIRGDHLTSRKYNMLSVINTSSNASVTVCSYRGTILGDGAIGRFFFPLRWRWQLIAWDDDTK